MGKPWRKAGAALLVLSAGLMIFSHVAPGVVLRYYFWLERKLNLPAMRDFEPLLIKAGVLRPARVRVRGGFTMLLDPRDMVPLSLLHAEEWQPEVWDSLLPSLPKGAVFLDVGAHIGIFTLKAVKQIGPEGKVVSFEPNPETAKLLRDNISANHLDNVTVEEIACTDKERELTLYAAPVSNTGASSLSPLNAAYGAPPRPFAVHGRPIDDVVRELNLARVDAMKIDVEGAELEVLRGAVATIKRFHPRIVTEMVPERLASFHTTPQQVESLIRSAGYTVGAPLHPGSTDWQWTVAQSTINMGDPVVAGQLLRGFRGIEANTWRWTRGHFDVVLRPPEDSRGATLVGKFIFPNVVQQKIQQVRLSARIGGTELSAVTYIQPGTYEYRAEVAAGLLRDNPTEIDFTLDRAMQDGNEEFGLMALSISLEPRAIR